MTTRSHSQPLTIENWSDFETLFGARGACGGCWCMAWRLEKAAFEAGKGSKNKSRMKAIVRRGSVPGIMLYAGDEAVGWCSVDRRRSFCRLANSRILAPVDATDVWSIVCFFIKKGWRRQGMSRQLIRAAVEYVRAQGGGVLEAYPVDASKNTPDPFVWVGLASAFEKEGFTEVARRSSSRPIMRYRVD